MVACEVKRNLLRLQPHFQVSCKQQLQRSSLSIRTRPKMNLKQSSEYNMAPGLPDVKQTFETEEHSEEGSGKKKSKFQSFKNFFAKKKRKEPSASQGESPLKPSQSSGDVSTQEPTAVTIDLDNESGSKGNMGNKALSHDSVFISELPSSENKAGEEPSQENIPGKVKALQLQLQQNIRLGSPPVVITTKKLDDTGTLSEDDGLPRSPPEISTLHDVLTCSTSRSSNPVQRHSSLSIGGTDSEDEQMSSGASSRPISPVPSSVSMIPTLPGNSILPVDFSSAATTLGCLDNTAAKHRIALNPRKQKAFTKKNKLTIKEHSESLKTPDLIHVEEEQKDNSLKYFAETIDESKKDKGLLTQNEVIWTTIKDDEEKTETDESVYVKSAFQSSIAMETVDGQLAVSEEMSCTVTTSGFETSLDMKSASAQQEETSSVIDPNKLDIYIQTSVNESAQFSETVLTESQVTPSQVKDDLELQVLVVFKEIREDADDSVPENIPQALQVATKDTQEEQMENDETPIGTEKVWPHSDKEDDVKQDTEILSSASKVIIDITETSSEMEMNVSENVFLLISNTDEGAKETTEVSMAAEIMESCVAEVDTKHSEQVLEEHICQVKSHLKESVNESLTFSEDSSDHWTEERGRSPVVNYSNESVHSGDHFSPMLGKASDPSFPNIQDNTIEEPVSEKSIYLPCPEVEECASETSTCLPCREMGNDASEKSGCFPSQEMEIPSTPEEPISLLCQEQTCKALEMQNEQKCTTKPIRFTIAPAWQRSLSGGSSLREDIQVNDPPSSPIMPDLFEGVPGDNDVAEVNMQCSLKQNSGGVGIIEKEVVTTLNNQIKQTENETQSAETPFGVKLRRTSSLLKYSAESNETQRIMGLLIHTKVTSAPVKDKNAISHDAGKPLQTSPTSNKPVLPRKPDLLDENVSDFAKPQNEEIPKKKHSKGISEQISSTPVEAASSEPTWVSMAKQKQKGFQGHPLCKELKTEEKTAIEINKETEIKLSKEKASRKNSSSSYSSRDITDQPKVTTSATTAGSCSQGLPQYSVIGKEGRQPPNLNVAPHSPVEPPWLSLAKKKAKAWSEMPQIVQ
nr:PREDICTED: uncharacterized protein KIAA1210 homolog isoform X2 [Latimeria chalumnae]|eukprot:XP_014348685.1 PREDICTED: uncharacterized protein KIAA1210 homolog isoform X2 [Latimeria chalumnae]